MPNPMSQTRERSNDSRNYDHPGHRTFQSTERQIEVALWELRDGMYYPIEGQFATTEGMEPPPEIMDIPDDPASMAPGAGGSSQKQVELEMRKKEFIIDGRVESAFPNPYLIAGKPIKLENLGYNFSGEYAVTSVTHTISLSGYTQEISIERNAAGISYLEKSEPADAQASRPKQSDAEPEKEEETYHTVVSGDNLWNIAKKYYGNGADYTKIVEANPEIKDPHLIYPGQEFLIP